jgi:tetratricopeptide (TPR) repeat protein
MLDQAERLYRGAADADPRNSIAVVGLARVDLERGDEPAAWRHAQAALAIDPENVAASRLVERLEEVWAYRGESLPEVARAEVALPAQGSPPPPVAPASAETRPEPAPAPVPAPAPARPPHHGVVDRLLRRNRP